MQLFQLCSAALLLVLLMASPALDYVTRFMWGSCERKPWRLALRNLWASDIGTTITYCWPGGPAGNTTSAPTAAAAAAVNEMTVKVAMGDTETSAVVVHNWGLPASAPSFLFPLVTYYQDTIGVGPSTDLATLTFDLTNTNQVTITKLNALGSGGTFRVFLQRPTSLIR